MGLKPIEMLPLIASDQGWDAAELARKQNLLLEELLRPRDVAGVGGVFAHGAEALRARQVAPYVNLVEAYCPVQEAWVKVAEHTACQSAVDEAKGWYPLPDKDSMIHKWDRARDRRVRDCAEMLRTAFPDQVALAEFWYDTKNLAWPERFGSSPWEFASNVAGTCFADRGQPNSAFSDEYQATLRKALDFIETEWACEEMTGSLVRRFLCQTYDFFEGELQYQGAPVTEGGFTHCMTDLERDVLQKAVGVAQAVFDGSVWASMAPRARAEFLSAEFAVSPEIRSEAIQSITRLDWGNLGLQQRTAIGRQLGHWIDAGRLEGCRLADVFGRQPQPVDAEVQMLGRAVDVGILLQPSETRLPLAANGGGEVVRVGAPPAMPRHDVRSRQATSSAGCEM